MLLGTAQQQADTLRGEGDAIRNKVFADAFGKDPDFFAFYRSMSAYDHAFGAKDTRLVMSPSSSFFRFFRSPTGAPAEPAARPPEASNPNSAAR